METQNQSLQSEAHAGHVESQFLLGLQYLQRGLHMKAYRWLSRAAEKNHGEALHALARMHMQGLGPEAQPLKARRLLEQAVAAGSQAASLDIATLLALDATYTGDWQPMLECLIASALSGSAICCRQLGLLSQGETQQQWLRRAHENGDPLASRLLCALALANGNEGDLAHWRLHSKATPRILSGYHFERPAFAVAAEHSAPILLASHVDFQLASLPTTSAVYAPRLRGLSKAISPALCEYWIALAEPGLQESLVWNPYTGKAQRDAMRSNEYAVLGPEHVDPASIYWRSQLAGLAGLPECHGEWLSILHYRPGDQYQHHFDFLTAQHQDFAFGGHRRDTVLVYLNEGFTGGETDFPNVNVVIKPKLGDILHFCSMNEDGTLDQNSLHAGLPVATGEKWVASLWLRQEPYRRR